MLRRPFCWPFSRARRNQELKQTLIITCPGRHHFWPDRWGDGSEHRNQGNSYRLKRLLDSEGTVLGQLVRQVIQPGKMMSFDLNADDIVRENNRIQIRVVISGDTLRGLLTSTQVFENDTGKTTVFLGGPDT